MVLLRLSNTLNALARWRYISLAIFAAAVLTRTLGFILGGTRGDEDGAYLLMAQHYMDGRGIGTMGDFGWSPSWLPAGMPMLQIAALTLFGEILVSLRIFFITMSAIAIVCFFKLAKKLFQPGDALLATILLLLYPSLWLWSSRINPHTYALAGVIISIYLLFLAWERRSVLLPFLIGIFWATITLMRAEFALGIGVLVATSVLHYRWKKEGFICGLLLLAGFAAAMTPWVIRNYRLHGHFVLVSTNYGDNIWKSYNPAYQFKGEDIPFPPEIRERLLAEPNEVLRAKILTAEAKEFMREHPERVLRNVAGNFLNFWRPWVVGNASPLERIVYSAAYAPIFLLFLWGLFLLPWKNPYWLTIVGLLFYKNAINLPFYVIVLFREVVMPLIILIAVLPLARNRIMENQ